MIKLITWKGGCWPSVKRNNLISQFRMLLSCILNWRKKEASSFKRQATSVPARVTSVKHQATSSKLPDPRTMVHGYWRSIRGTRTEGLYHDKSIVRMACVKGDLVWTKSNFFTFRYLEFYSTKVPRSIIDQ